MSFIDFAAQYDLVVNEVVANGAIHRVPVSSGRRGNLDGAYCLHNDEKGFAGWLKNHRTGEYATYCAEQQTLIRIAGNATDKSLNLHQIEAIQNDVAKKAEFLIKHVFKKIYVHPYLEKKGIRPHGAQLDNNGALIVPLKNIYGEIRSFQRIEADGQKRFMSGGQKSGCFFQIGTIEKRAIICEGFATCASIFEATDTPTIAAMDAGNLEKVAVAIRNRYGAKLEIIIAGDDDHLTPINHGKIAAEKAALACNGRYTLPNFTPEEKELRLTDFNDLCTINVNRVKNALLNMNYG